MSGSAKVTSETVMRVTHISPTAFGATGLYGGGERYPLELARALAPHVEARLVTFGPRRAQELETSGLDVLTLRTLFRFKRRPVHPKAFGLRSAIAGSDIIHAHQMRSAPARQAALLARLGQMPICVTDHGLGGGGWAGLLPGMFDAFLTVSEYSAETLDAPPNRTHTIYGGVDPDRFRPDPHTVRGGVLFVGRITPHKGIDRLLPALPRNARLTIAGTRGHDRRPPESEYPKLVEMMATERDVHFAGRVHENHLPDLYRSARVFALPSVHTTCFGKRVPISELLGLSVLEAMASGTPVVASCIGGVSEIVVNGETGFLVEPGNVDELHDRLALVLADDNLARTMGEAGRERALQEFTWERCAKRCLAAYEEMLSGAL
jgi:glycosyltransferase involved in cell wall biosynthesis